MTMSDDLHQKLANVTAQLGRERTKNDQLAIDLENLRETYRVTEQRYRDACFQLRQFKERDQRAC